MTNEQDNIPTPPYSGPPMVRIDGKKIRRLREDRELTQLYLSTVIGVTTDTISRWENGRYQSIKLENGEKLARALEVSLADIQEEQPSADNPDNILKSSREADRPLSPFSRQLRPVPLIFALILLIAVISFLAFSKLTEEQGEPISAQRILPPHIPPGQSFPVLIQVSSPEHEPVSLILKETIPAGSSAPHGVPAITTVNKKNSSLKWISRTASNASVYAYMCRVPPGATVGEVLEFKGDVTLKQDTGEHEPIRGTSSVTIAPYHWADANRDLIIDDEEILSVYDLYSDIRDLPIDRDLIDNIWAGSGYKWNAETREYVVQE